MKSRGLSVRQELTTLKHVKQEINHRRSLRSLNSNRSWPYTSCLGHMASVKPYICICEGAFSKENFSWASSSSSLSHRSSSTGSGNQRGVQEFNSAGRDKVIMFSEYKFPLTILPR